MSDMRSALGFRVQTPCGPRKSGMPESVEIPAPVSTTTRSAASISARALSSEGLTCRDAASNAVTIERVVVELESEPGLVRHRQLAVHGLRNFLPEPRRPRHVLDRETVGHSGDEMHR